MKVIDGSSHLMRNDTGSSLSDDEVLGVQVRKEVASAKHFHHNVNIVLVLKHVIELDDVRVLTYFQNLNFSFQQLQVLQLKLFLLDDFDCNFRSCLLVDRILHKSILPFA